MTFFLPKDPTYLLEASALGLFFFLITFTSPRNTFTQRRTMKRMGVVLQKAFQYLIQNLYICSQQLFQKLLRARTSVPQVPLSSAAADTRKCHVSTFWQACTSVRMKEPLWCGASVLYSEHTGLNQCWTINLTVKTSNWILPYRILLSQCFHWQPRESSLTVWYRWSSVLSATPHRNVQVGVKPTFLLPRRRLRRHRRAWDLPPRRISQPRRSHPTRTPSVRPYKRQHSSLERTFPPRENVTVQCRKCQNAI